MSEYGADEYAFENIDYFNTAAQKLLDESVSLNISNRQAYDRRYGTQGAALEYVEVQVYRGNTLTPDFQFSSTTPFQKWGDMG